MFEVREQRDAYRRGVRDALESIALHQSGPQRRAMKQWIADLDAWDGGDPPVSPEKWASFTGRG